jgi:hypothetical protein
MSHAIQDEYTDLPISKQRKWALRHPAKQAEFYRKWKKTDKGKAANKRYRAKAIDAKRQPEHNTEKGNPYAPETSTSRQSSDH